MRITQNLIYSQLKNSLQQHQLGQNQAQQALASGRSLTRAAQDPAAMAAAMRAEDRQARLQSQDAISTIIAPRLAQSEAQLDRFGDVMQAARDLLLRAQNGALSAQDIQVLADELRGHAEAVVAVANTVGPDGRPVFAGSSSQLPFVGDLASGWTYHPPTAPALVEVGESVPLPLAVDAGELFLDASASLPLPDALLALADELELAPATPAQAAQRQANLDQALVDLDTVLERGLAAQADLGFQLQRLEQQQEQSQAEQLALQERLSSLVDTDVAQAASQLARESANLEAARTVFSRLQGLSLFNYLR